jgi:hypothetical protein
MSRKETDPVITTNSVTATVLFWLAVKTLFSLIVWKWGEWIWTLIFGKKKEKDAVDKGVPQEVQGDKA